MRSRFARLLGRCLPPAIRLDLFEPAARDLEMQYLIGRAQSGKSPSAGWLKLRVLWLFVDCWRHHARRLLPARATRGIGQSCAGATLQYKTCPPHVSAYTCARYS